MNSTDLAYQRDMFLLTFLDADCSTSVNADLSDYDDAIAEYGAMFDRAIFLNDKAEIKQLRREIQRTKAEKRLTKRLIDTNQKEMERAYS